MNFTDVQGTWKQIKQYIDSKISSSGADSLPVGTLLTTYQNKNIFSDKWHLADGASITGSSLYGLNQTEEDDSVILATARANVITFTCSNKVNRVCASCYFEGKFYAVASFYYDSSNNDKEDLYLIIINKDDCKQYKITTTYYSIRFNISVDKNGILIYERTNYNIIFYYSQSLSDIKIETTSFSTSDIDYESSHSCEGACMIGGGNVLVSFTPKYSYYKQYVYLIKNGSKNIINDLDGYKIQRLGSLNNNAYFYSDSNIYRISSSYEVTLVASGVQYNINYGSNYAFVQLTNPTKYVVTKDFITYFERSSTNYTDVVKYVNFIYTYKYQPNRYYDKRFCLYRNGKDVTISTMHTLISAMVDNQVLYLLEFYYDEENYKNTFYIYPIRIENNAKSLPVISNTYIKIK